MKQFAVIGLGNFGAMVAKTLTELKCKVTAVDVDKARVQPLQERSSLVAVLADATDRKFLENLGVEQFDCIIVSTGENSHASILISLHLKELGAQKIFVKANSEDHAKILLKVGATEAIIPEEQMAIKLSRSLAQPNLIDFLPLAGDHCVAELVPPANFVDKQLLELKLRTKYHIQVVAVKNGATGSFDFVPGGDYKVTSSDILVVLGKEADINKVKG